MSTYYGIVKPNSFNKDANTVDVTINSPHTESTTYDVEVVTIPTESHPLHKGVVVCFNKDDSYHSVRPPLGVKFPDGFENTIDKVEELTEEKDCFGVVVSYYVKENTDKNSKFGYGFISYKGNRIFCHNSEIKAKRSRYLKRYEGVRFDLEKDDKGRFVCRNIRSPFGYRLACKR